MTDNDRDKRTINDMGDVPKFADEADEAAFWAEHELGDDLLDRMTKRPEGVLPSARPRAKPISVRVEPDLLTALKAEAKRSDVPYQSLLKQLAAEGLAVRASASDTTQRTESPARRSTAARSERTAMAAAAQTESLVAVFPRMTDARRTCRHAEVVRRRGAVLAYSG